MVESRGSSARTIARRPQPGRDSAPRARTLKIDGRQLMTGPGHRITSHPNGFSSHPLRRNPTNHVAPAAPEPPASQQLATRGVRRKQSHFVAPKKRKKLRATKPPRGTDFTSVRPIATVETPTNQLAREAQCRREDRSQSSSAPPASPRETALAPTDNEPRTIVARNDQYRIKTR
jgi:hypothetical protein